MAARLALADVVQGFPERCTRLGARCPLARPCSNVPAARGLPLHTDAGGPSEGTGVPLPIDSEQTRAHSCLSFREPVSGPGVQGTVAAGYLGTGPWRGLSHLLLLLSPAPLSPKPQNRPFLPLNLDVIGMWGVTRWAAEVTG